MPQRKIFFLVGPTAIGKSALAIRLAKKLNCEIISLDSMQIYKGLDILSSKPSKSMRKAIAHHLLDIASPNQNFDAARYRKSALKKIEEIYSRGKIPLFTGGTGLYMSVLIDGIFKEVKTNEALREKLYAQAKRRGGDYLHRKLKGVDKAAAGKIHPHDLRRIIRALEVYQLTGKPISELWKKRSGLSGKYDIKIFGLNKDRQDLYNDINARVEKMFQNGLVNEVKKLLKEKLSLTCAQAIGIKEISGYLEGVYDLAGARELLKKNTRNYAKRQLTWFKKDKRVRWIDAGKADPLKEIISAI
ncbi:tRNA (adenosine(37)-N6)-dimethylallyltransferase MiaA [bacterium]|nr:MAG: tRNA (adenosine(37)-N6)-dimethylallyltransferase MiaA [bacterium]